MNNIAKIGQTIWKSEDMLKKIDEFLSFYQEKPIKENEGGMKSPHMFLSWFVLQTLKPKVIVESGVWLGQGTWLFEKACPEAELYCIDLNLDRIQYKSKNANYFNKDFSTMDWSHLPKNDTVLFFDDHQNAYNRVITANWFGFKHLLFEDNYPPSQGDCYSLKKVFAHSGFKPKPPKPTSTIAQMKQKIKKAITKKSSNTEIQPNNIDALYLMQNLETYCELPPVIKTDKTRWGDSWSDENYPTPEPLLNSAEKESQKVFLNEAVHYTWMCYAKLK